jgi:SAM-dependent MidA family methyltransferase
MKAQVDIACAFCVRKLLAPVKTKLQRKIIERISRDGPITFRDFMQAALYDPELGYYNTERLKIGPQGDYYTSSNVHADFGAMLSRLFAELWADSDEPLTIVEIGPGTGQLAYMSFRRCAASIGNLQQIDLPASRSKSVYAKAPTGKAGGL